MSDQLWYDELIYTGPVDEYFDLCYGKPPYRSLRFDQQTLAEMDYQPVSVVNYPNDHAYSRITEYKKLRGQEPLKRVLPSNTPRRKAIRIILYQGLKTPNSIVSTSTGRTSNRGFISWDAWARTAIITWIRSWLRP